MKQRIITGLIIIFIVLPPLVIGGWLMDLLAMFVAVVGAYELVKVCQNKFDFTLYAAILIFLGVFAASNPQTYGYSIIVYMMFLLSIAIFDERYQLEDLCLFFAFSLIFAFALVTILMIYQTNSLLMMLVVLATFGTDVGAYFTGYFFGRHKLNPRVSPKKTVEGAIGGWIIGFALSATFGYYFLPQFPMVMIIIASVILPLVSQIGDLTFSLLKRRRNIKDFGNIFPGHGGVLDRVDSLLISLLMFYVIVGVLG